MNVQLTTDIVEEEAYQAGAQDLLNLYTEPRSIRPRVPFDSVDVVPNLLLYRVPAVALGIARAAFDEFIAMALAKPITFAASQ